MHPLAWLRQHDVGLSALRRAARAAIVRPDVFAIAEEVIDNSTVAIFAAFGSFAMLLFVDFTGPMRGAAPRRSGGGPGWSSSVWARWLRGVRGRGDSMLVVGLVCFSWPWSARCSPSRHRTSVWPSCLPVTAGPGQSLMPDRLAGWALAARRR